MRLIPRTEIEHLIAARVQTVAESMPEFKGIATHRDSLLSFIAMARSMMCDHGNGLDCSQCTALEYDIAIH